MADYYLTIGALCMRGTTLLWAHYSMSFLMTYRITAGTAIAWCLLRYRNKQLNNELLGE
jgi:hypothetical protein